MTSETSDSPWLLRSAGNPDLSTQLDEVSSSEYGAFDEYKVTDILRAIGYLARVCQDNGQAEEAQEAVAKLEQRYHELKPNEHRSIVAGLTTALGYLGQGEPLLTHLGPGEPWMHEAAMNVFEHWVLEPPDGTEERERALVWINRRLAMPDLEPQVRTTLLQLRKELAVSLGHF